VKVDSRPRRGSDERSQKSCEHGSPANGVELARYTLGRIDLDPCSSTYWNHHIVRATRFFDRRINGLKQPWSGTVWLNPPGADEDAGTENLVRPCWDKLVEHWRAGELEGAIWWGYSLEQLQALQLGGRAWHPARCLTLLLSGRPRHMVRSAAGGPPVEGAAPMHGGFCTLLPSVRFHGQVVRPAA
jgi:hypothetical protein